MNKQILVGEFHTEIPEDLIQILSSNEDILLKWNNLTPIQRNEWICWITIVKKEETRIKHLKRLEEDLLKNKKTPCCWPGCPHRNPNSKKFFKNI